MACDLKGKVADVASAVKLSMHSFDEVLTLLEDILLERGDTSDYLASYPQLLGGLDNFEFATREDGKSDGQDVNLAVDGLNHNSSSRIELTQVFLAGPVYILASDSEL